MERKFMKGNEALAEAAVRAGCRFFAGYPITPQNEIPEYFSRRLPEVGGTFVQGESEVASINMVIGSAFMGTRAMTSTSGPGLSLMCEGLSSLAGYGFPAVIMDVVRGGPGTGSIQAAQSDYLMLTRGAGHGGFKSLVYAPGDVQEAVDLVGKAFDKAWEYKNPTFVAVDGCIGSMMEVVELPEVREFEREEFPIYSSSKFGQTNPDVRMSTSMIISEPEQEKWNMIIADKWAEMEKNECMVEEFMVEDAEMVTVAYGTSARIARAAIEILREEGYKIGLIRPITIWPFPYDSIKALDSDVCKKIFCLELSIPVQVIQDVEIGAQGRFEISSYGRTAGQVYTTEDVVEKMRALMD